jgi:hypothetical protein
MTIWGILLGLWAITGPVLLGKDQYPQRFRRHDSNWEHGIGWGRSFGPTWYLCCMLWLCTAYPE